ncbi:MAG: DUF4363 family protein [Clostridia bacterium]|nr:DUF4363 family protein [Clostridia bacterium]
MKRIWIALGLSVFVVLLCFFECKIVSDMYKELDISSKEVISSLEESNFDLANSQIDDLEKNWSDYKGILSVFLNHDTINNIDNCILKIKLSAKSNHIRQALFFSYCLNTSFYDINQSEQISIENIF